MTVVNFKIETTSSFLLLKHTSIHSAHSAVNMSKSTSYQVFESYLGKMLTKLLLWTDMVLQLNAKLFDYKSPRTQVLGTFF